MNVVDFKSLKEGNQINDGLVYVQEYSKKSYSNGKKFYVAGTFMHKGVAVDFTIWDAKLVEILSSNDVQGAIVKISGTVGVYRDKLQITVQTVDFNHGYTDMSAFLKSVNVPEVFQEFTNFINDNLTSYAISVVLDLFKAENLFDDFKMEFAGSRMHDAQVGGLMNHTLKMLKIAKNLVVNDDRLVKYADLLYLGIILHDIGKIFELEMGKYTLNSFVTHRTLGVELVAKHKENIVKLFDETFYYHLLAIIQGHHGEWGDAPTTVWAYVVHLIDMVDAMVTGVLDRLDNNDVKTEPNGQVKVYVNGGNLVV